MFHPLLYEINTRCWLRALSHRHGGAVTLATVPDEEFAQWKKCGFTHIWLMGVWTTGPRAREMAMNEPNLRRAYDELLPDWRDEDVAGSPYSIAAYEVPRTLGGEAGLKDFRNRLHQAGLKLILDFVPNHLGIDHRWLHKQPELFVQSAAPVEGTIAQSTPDGTRWIALAKDPYFPPWSDVVQLEYRSALTRARMQDLLLSVVERCDGVRCDMAMLLLNDVFARTWADFPFPGKHPETEFWEEAIPAVRQVRPDFLFLAEVYWGLEGCMQSLGFDYTYDKQLYDDLIWRNPSGVQKHLLGATQSFVAACAHFLENHDERRVAGVLTLEEHRAAALVTLGLPGMRFLHEGQLTGARIKAPVQLGRLPAEATQPEVREMYDSILTALTRSAVGRGQGEVLTPREAWPGNGTAQNFVVVQWQAHPVEFDLVVVNLAPHRSQCYVSLKVPNLSTHNWSLRDLLGAEGYERFGNDLEGQGLYLDCPAHGAQLFHFTPVK
ncbi:MAG: alpha-amylase [Verrucomicrobiae bacterium]|nr:alpha-amylase [Verrucomicrobiae bacterium]